MGGFETEITDKTTTVVLEAANFNSASIRRTSRAVGLHSEASGRFERGVDINKTIPALDRAAQLLQDMGACKVVKGIVDNYPVKREPSTVEFTVAKINDRLGTRLSNEEVLDILNKLGGEISEVGNGIYTFKVPSHRTDITIVEDLSEEVARIYGYDRIESTLPYGRTVQGHQSAQQNFIDAIKSALTSLGMDEELSFAFTNPPTFDKLNVPVDSDLRRAVPIMNPLNDEYPLVRTNLLSSVLENVARNFNRKNEDVRLFEVAPVFYPKAIPVVEQPIETLKLAGVISGRREPKGWSQASAEVDFYDLKGIVEELLERLSIKKCTVERGEHFAMHPGKTAVFNKGKETLITFGELHPKVAAAFELSKKVYVFEADVATLMKYAAKAFRYESLPKYPSITRDLAILVDERIAAGDVEKVIVKNGGKEFSSVTLFDVYAGKGIAEGKKSLAFTLKFQSNDRTLTNAEVDEAFANILSAIEKNCNAQLRA